MFPDELKERIYDLIGENRLSTLAAHSQQLTERYHKPRQGRFMETEGHRLSYLLTRMPATYAAVSKVLEEALARMPSLSLESMLDLGAGPGTGMWALRGIFQGLTKITLMEQDAALIALGKKLAPGIGRWIQADLEKAEAFDSHDLVLLSYALGELQKREDVALKAWQAAKQMLVIVEPGTPVGFERLKVIRELLISKGAHLLAPCPHSQSCPLKQGDWCHFSTRLARTSLHRQIKGGSLGYEDEKFFYLIFSKTKSQNTVEARVLRHPQKHSGFVELSLCSKKRLEQKIISRKDKENYRLARKTEWGDIVK